MLHLNVMGKKVSKSKKTSKRVIRKKSLFERLFSFPKLTFYSFLILSFFIVFQVTRPSPGVMGVADETDYQIYSRAEFEKIAANPSAEERKKYYFYVGIWKDEDGDAKNDNSEDCLLKEFSFTINGNRKTKQIEDGFCGLPVVRSPNRCNTITFDTSTLKTYKVTGLSYIDGVSPDPSSLKGKISKYFCAGKRYYDLQYGVITWGLKKK